MTRFVPMLCVLVAFALIVAAAATYNWSHLVRTIDGQLVIEFGPFRTCFIDFTNNLSCQTMSNDDVNAYCKSFADNGAGFPSKFCNSWQATRAFSGLAAIGAGVTFFVALFASVSKSPTVKVFIITAVFSAFTGLFALFAFAIGYDTFVNQFKDFENSAFPTAVYTSSVESSAGLMIGGWLAAWIGAVVSAVIAKNRNSNTGFSSSV